MRFFILLLCLSPVAFASSFGSCGCKWDQIWNDVIYLIDSSALSGNSGVQNMWGAVQASSAWYNIQKTGYTQSNYTMRVGLISYSANASVVAPLGTVDNQDIQNMEQFPYSGGPIGNIESAIYAAINQFSGPNHRKGSRPVIIIMAADANDNDNAMNVAEIFKQSGGAIIVMQYLAAHQEPSDTLHRIASKGYFLANNALQDLQNANCDANCFCPDNAISISDDNRYVPQDGCYRESYVMVNYNLASNNCKKLNNGVVAMTESATKARFVAAFFGDKGNFYIGITFDNITKSWMWADGIPVGNSSNWLGGQIPAGTNGQTCVYMVASTQQWVATDCRNSYMYVCESPPCGSLYYCGF